MKKSLVALAALAVVGAASAQSTVTLSGKLAFAYQSAESARDIAAGTTMKKNGLGVTDGDFVLTASEDLGGGMKATASMAVLSRGRDTAISGRDASLNVSGGFGTVTIGALEAANGILGLGGAGAPTIGMDGARGVATNYAVAPAVSTYSLSRAALDAAVNVDILQYTSPDFNGFKVAVAMLEAGAAPYGMESTSTAQDATLLRVTYAGGPVAVMADYTNYGLNAVAVGADDRIRVSGSYDLGVVKLGAGYQTKKTTATTNNGNKQYILGVSAPVGAAVTVGANYVRNTQDGGTLIKGYELGANYALSKRTGVQLAYQNLNESDANGAVSASSGNATAFRVRLMHSF